MQDKRSVNIGIKIYIFWNYLKRSLNRTGLEGGPGRSARHSPSEETPEDLEDGLSPDARYPHFLARLRGTGEDLHR
jgi:hypothetical protein